MDIKKRLKDIDYDDYQGFLAQIHDAWQRQCAMINDTVPTLYDSSVADEVEEDDYFHYIPVIREGIAYFSCMKQIAGEEWEDSEIGIPSKIWFRFLYKPETTFVTYRMIY